MPNLSALAVALLAMGLWNQAPDAQRPMPGPRLFTDEERAKVMAYWSQPGRYRIDLPEDSAKVGRWVVRLTPPASTWLLAYNRARGAAKAPPTDAIPTGSADLSADWEPWVAAKLKYDRAVAQAQADSVNAQIRGATAPPEAKLPPLPGPIPAALLAAAGNPPVLAAAVTPRRYTIAFNTGDTIRYSDQVPVGPRYAYFRFAQGVMFAGTPVRTMSDAEAEALFGASGMIPFEQHVVRAVSRLEGGFESVNTYDTGYLSVGFIQFATLAGGAGSLGEVLAREKRDVRDSFEADFRRYGLDVNDAGALVALDPDTGAELAGSDAVLKVIDDKRLTAVFQLAGAKIGAFRAAQVRVAKDHYYPADDPLTVTVGGRTLTGKVSDIIKSEAGMATLFDRKVNRGTIDPCADVVAKTMVSHNLSELPQAAAYEREIVAALKYRVDFLADQSLTQPER